MGFFSRRKSVTPEEAGLGLLLLLWTWRHEDFLPDYSANPPSTDLQRELYGLQYFALCSASERALRGSKAELERTLDSLRQFHEIFARTPLEDLPTPLRDILRDVAARDPAGYERLRRTKLVVPREAVDEWASAMFASAIQQQNPIAAIGDAFATMNPEASDPITQARIAQTFVATWRTTLSSFESWRLRL